ncbi:MAG: C39 family peptidase [Polyangiaceae bacterium]
MAKKKKRNPTGSRAHRGLLSRSAVPLRPSAPRRKGRALGGGPPGSELSFEMDPQQQTNWCWAAVSTSTASFYDSTNAWSQCKLACDQLNMGTCCSNGGSGACDQPWYLDKALARVGHFQSMSGGAATFATVQATIDAGKPLGVRIAWASGGAHFVAVRGYVNDQQMLDVEDPFYGPSQIPYATFVSTYLGSGSWTHSYFTC